uniref:Uncharacterized protein n=1 Tax=Pithovirus LCPAC304 TaxID=2506594 RepID=A0A481Z910_9VIRU|nr:MAG: hypothetical protein LCPAC304_04430 [Pithovirus LCPAC304]
MLLFLVICLLLKDSQQLSTEIISDYKVIHTFSGFDGKEPLGALLWTKSGLLYGTTSSGGKHGYGTIFKIDKNDTFSSIHHFNGTDGSTPTYRLIQNPNQDIFGVTTKGGHYNKGVIFQVNVNDIVCSIYHFSGADGDFPTSLSVGRDPNKIYGTTGKGGRFGNGVIFRAGIYGGLSVIHDLSLTTDGSFPICLITTGIDNFHGITLKGPTNQPQSNGGLFQLTQKGDFKFLYLFDHIGTPAGLSVHDEQTFYGTSLNDGAIFKANSSVKNPPDRYVPVLNYVLNSGLSLPYNGVTYSNSNGFLYGTVAKVEGIYPSGAVYKINASDFGSAVIILHTFGVNLDDTALVPKTVPTETTPRVFYGVTFESTPGFGTVYKFIDK